MTPLLVVGGVLILLFVLLALRAPIAIALSLVSVLGIAILRGWNTAWVSMGSLPYDFAAHWSLSAIPLFLLMGALAYHGGLTASLFDAARVWLGRTPGGLAVATNAASAMFAAASGSSLATAAAMTRLAVPEMLKRGYDPGLATGTVAAAGTVGALIPPSIAFVIYGWYTETPIGSLLMAGILPGLLTSLAYAALIIIRVKLNPKLAPTRDEPHSWGERFDALRKVWPIPLLIFAVVGSIYSGFATATESAAMGAIATLLLCIVRGVMSVSLIRQALYDSIKSAASIFFIALGATLFTRFLALSGMPNMVGGYIAGLDLSPYLVVLVMIGLYLLLGMFLDPIGIMLITLPMLLPIFKAVGMDLVWIGVLVVKMIEVGLLTPPVGLNVYVVKAVVGDKISLSCIFRGTSWFLMAEVVVIALLVLFPQISLFLPGLM
jgi:tripartite ATP-independent transporter DctM subunit